MINEKHKSSQPLVALVLIGNEVLSGRTKDKNLNFIAKRCGAIGLCLSEVRVIPDIQDVIVQTVKELSAKYEHVFTTGGIGPTHDDITSECIARVCNVKLVKNKEAYRRLNEYYKNSSLNLNSAREKMTFIPEGANLIDNPVSIAPGFHIKNIWVMAGVPKIMQAMFTGYIEKHLVGGLPTISKSIKIFCPEGEIASIMDEVQTMNSEIDIGSYPFYNPPSIGTSVVFKGTNKYVIKKAYNELLERLNIHNIPHK